MDPITMAAQRFVEGVGAFLRRPRARTLRIVAPLEERRHVVQALRLLERARDNQRRFFLHEEPFVTADQYFSALAGKLAADFRIRAPREGDGMRRAALAVARAAECVPAGLLVALLPPHDVPSMRTWTRMPFPLGVKLAVFGGDVGDMEARFSIDYRELARFYASSAREAVEARGALVQAFLASVGGDVSRAKVALRKALDGCKARGLIGEAEAVLLALAGADLDDRDAARSGLVEAAQLAEVRADAGGVARAWRAIEALAKVDGMTEAATLARERATKLKGDPS